MAITHGTTARNNMADGVDDAVNSGTGAGVFVILDGATDIVSFTLDATAFGAASGGTIAASGLPKTAAATATGTNVDAFEIRTSGGTAQVSGTVGTATGTSDFQVDNTNIASGQTVSLTQLSWNAPS